MPPTRTPNETPFLLIRNSHCEPCVGCAKNCYDFNPRVAKLADFDDDDPLYMAFLRYCEHQGLRPSGHLLVQTSQLAEELVARELGWTVVDFRTAAMRRKDVVVTPLQPYVECSMNAFFAKNHSPTLLARRMADTVKAVLKEGV